MANAVLFLASDESSFITASTFLVDGGISGAYVTPAVTHASLTGHRAHHLPRGGGLGGLAASAPTCCRRSTPTPWSRRRRRPGAAAPGLGRTPTRRAVVAPARRPGRSAGGADVDPGRYGEEPHARDRRLAAGPGRLGARPCSTPPTRPACRSSGVCRGMQLMAVPPAAPSTSTRPTSSATSEHSPGGDELRRGRRCAPSRGSRVARVWSASARGQLPPPPVGARRIPGSTPRPGPTTARSRRWSAPADRFCVGVQWHPETAATSACSPAWSGPPRRTCVTAAIRLTMSPPTTTWRPDVLGAPYIVETIELARRREGPVVATWCDRPAERAHGPGGAARARVRRLLLPDRVRRVVERRAATTSTRSTCASTAARCASTRPPTTSTTCATTSPRSTRPGRG